jgi:hypothetical protein
MELRAAIALGQEMVARGSAEEGREIVKELRAKFDQGLETKDLRDADDFLAGKPVTPF